MPIPTDEERLGTLVGSKYRLHSIIGRGGMGVVYRAVHTWTDRQVAVKMLKPDYAIHASVTSRFLREAKSAALLNHPHVVDVLDMGADDPHTVYIVLEHLEGESLHTFIERHGRLSPLQTYELLAPVMLALDAAHAGGIVHRDIKPENIFLSVDGAGQLVVKLLDFGIAKLTEQMPSGRSTLNGVLMGTPHYMSPEQARGDDEIGPPADVWSLAVVAYECLAGAMPFDGDKITDVLEAVISGEHMPLASICSDITLELSDVMDQSFLPLSRRFTTIRQFAVAFAQAVQARHPWADTRTIRPLAAPIASVSPGVVNTSPSAVGSVSNPTQPEIDDSARHTPLSVDDAFEREPSLLPYSSNRKWFVAFCAAAVVISGSSLWFTHTAPELPARGFATQFAVAEPVAPLTGGPLGATFLEIPAAPRSVAHEPLHANAPAKRSRASRRARVIQTPQALEATPLVPDSVVASDAAEAHADATPASEEADASVSLVAESPY